MLLWYLLVRQRISTALKSWEWSGRFSSTDVLVEVMQKLFVMLVWTIKILDLQAQSFWTKDHIRILIPVVYRIWIHSGRHWRYRPRSITPRILHRQIIIRRINFLCLTYNFVNGKRLVSVMWLDFLMVWIHSTFGTFFLRLSLNINVDRLRNGVGIKYQIIVSFLTHEVLLDISHVILLKWVRNLLNIHWIGVYCKGLWGVHQWILRPYWFKSVLWRGHYSIFIYKSRYYE